MSFYERALGVQISLRDIEVESTVETIERFRVATPPRRIGERGTRFVRFPGPRGPIESIRSAGIRIVMGAAIALWASVVTLLVTPTRASATPTITNDTANKLVTITGSRYVMKFSYNSRAIITSLQVDGNETLDTTSSPTQGTYSAVKVASTWYTTQSLSTSPSVSVSGNVVTATLSTSVASETWTFTAADSNISFALARTYNAAYTVVTQGTPMLNFAPAAFDTIRWPADGGSFPVDGSLLNTNAGSWLADGTKYSANTRSSKEQTSFTLLNRSNQLALIVTGSTSNDTVSRGAATELSRAATNVAHDLRLSLVTSSAGLAYATGTTYGYSNDNIGNGLNGMTRQDGGYIFGSVAVANGHTDTVTLTFTPDGWSNYYNLGTLKGVDSTQLSALINDYARFMIQNANRGASTEQSVVQAELPPLEMHWIAELLEVFPDSVAINAVKAGLNDISNHLVNSSGQVSCCRPGTTDTWAGRFYYDQAPGFVIGVADVFQQSGDTTWLTGIAPNVRLALDYEVNNDTDATTHLVLDAHTTGASTTYQNNYWESTNGTYDGYTTALLYEALTKWAALEGDVLGNPTNASYYSGIASTIKTNFNLPLSSGGLWSPTTNTFYYGSGNADALYLPVNAEVLKTDLASPSRRQAIAQAIETRDANGNYDMHPMNTVDLFTAGQTAPTGSRTATKSGENGGWYGAPDGEFYAGLTALHDPQLINSYVSSLLDRYGNDGFFGGTTWDRNDWLLPVDSLAQWFPTTAMPAWGLYHYQYGLQPADTDLALAPFISPNEVGSTVKWTWRGQPMSVTYDTQTSFTVAAPVMPTNIRIDFINQVSGNTYHVRVDGGTVYPTTADSNGTVETLFSKVDAGTHTFDCYDCSASSDAGSGSTSLVTSVSTSGVNLRNDTTQQVGVKISTDSSGAITARQLGRYFVAGNSHVHTLKLLDASMHILGTATVDEGAGTADGLGFKYGSLDKPVILQPNSTYYLYSLETKGGDQWYDYQTVEATTSVAHFASAAYGRTPTTIGGSGNSYCPLNIKY